MEDLDLMTTGGKDQATQEVEKTSSNGLGAVSGVGRFVAQIIKEPSEQLAGLFADRLRYMRIRKALSFKACLQESMLGTDVELLTKKLPLNVIYVPC